MTSIKRNLIIAVAILLLIGGFRSYAAQDTVGSLYDPANYGLPDRVAGYNLLAVITADNSPCLASKSGIRYILQTSYSTVEQFLAQSNTEVLDSELAKVTNLPIADLDYQIVGPGISLSEVMATNELVKITLNSKSCAKAVTPVYTANNGNEIKLSSPKPGFTIIEDLDAGNYTDDNAQSVYLRAPIVGFNQDPDPDNNKGSRFVNNVTSATGGYVLQNGFAFLNGTGIVFFTNSTANFSIQAFNISYTATHLYWFTISYTNAKWWMCVNDQNIPNGASYVCQDDPNAPGTQMTYGLDTSVWVEDWNTNPNWYQGFGLFNAYQARLYRNGVGQQWTTQHLHTADACTANYPTTNAITGSGLVNGQSVTFALDKVPPYC